MRAGWGAAFTVEEGPEQKLVIVLELERHQRAEAAEVIGAIRRDVAGEHELVVDSIVLVRAGSIPKTSSGKIQRHACRDAFLDRSLDVVAEWHRAGSDGPIAAASAPRRRHAAGRGAERQAGRAAEPPGGGCSAAHRRRTAAALRPAGRHSRRRPRSCWTWCGRSARSGRSGSSWTRRSSSWGSTRWSGWRSSPRWRTTSAAGSRSR